MDVEGSGVLVVGGSGLGAASARALAQRGAVVTIADLDRERGEGVARDIGGNFAHCDVRDEASVESAVAGAVASSGANGLRIAVSCAGIP